MGWMEPFNSNIRCIEMLFAEGDTGGNTEFNSNIRCIEMLVYKGLLDKFDKV